MATRPHKKATTEPEPDVDNVIEEPIELEGGELEIEEPEEEEPEVKQQTLAEKVSAELTALAGDPTRTVINLRSLVMQNAPKNPTPEEAKNFFVFFERLKRVTESAYLTAQELTTGKY